jgi:hypothetical protein
MAIITPLLKSIFSSLLSVFIACQCGSLFSFPPIIRMGAARGEFFRGHRLPAFVISLFRPCLPDPALVLYRPYGLRSSPNLRVYDCRRFFYPPKIQSSLDDIQFCTPGQQGRVDFIGTLPALKSISLLTLEGRRIANELVNRLQLDQVQSLVLFQQKKWQYQLRATSSLDCGDAPGELITGSRPFYSDSGNRSAEQLVKEFDYNRFTHSNVDRSSVGSPSVSSSRLIASVPLVNPDATLSVDDSGRVGKIRFRHAGLDVGPGLLRLSDEVCEVPAAARLVPNIKGYKS